MKKFISMLFVFILFMSLPPYESRANVTDAGKQSFSVLFNQESIPAHFEQHIKSIGGEVTYSVHEIGFAQVKVAPHSFSELKGMPGVSAVNPSVSWTIPQSPVIKAGSLNYFDRPVFWEMQWDMKRITNNGESYKLGTGSHDIVIGIIDSGIDRNHPDLVSNLLPGSKNFVPAGGFGGAEPYEEGDPKAFDDIHIQGHGTQVAGAIAANGKMLGAAPDTGIRAYRVFGRSSAESSWIFAALIAAADDGCDVISMSLAGYDVIGQAFYTDPTTGKKQNLGNHVADFKAYKRAVEYATNKGSLVVVAAGNESLNATNKKEVINYMNKAYAGNGLSFVGAGFAMPGTLPGVVTVSATGRHDVLANYSNYGPGFIDIAAVGGDTKVYEQYAAEGKLDEYMAKRLYEQEFNLRQI